MKVHVAALLLTIATALPAIASPNVEVFDGNGVRLGYLLGPSDFNFWLISDQGYTARINSDGSLGQNASFGSTWYTTSNCTGQGFAFSPPVQGVVFSSGDARLYLPRNIQPTRVAVGDTLYEFTGASCVRRDFGINSPPAWILPLLENDPGETGIDDGPFEPPFKFTWTPILDDGFESNT